MFISILHNGATNVIATRVSGSGLTQKPTLDTWVLPRTLALLAFIAAAFGVFTTPLLVAIFLGHYSLLMTSKDAPATDLHTPTTRGLAIIGLIIAYVWVAVLLLSWLLQGLA